jgi:ankyrin
VSCIDKQGKTPLHIACEQHHTQIVQFLCDNGADGNALSSENDTPFLGACRKINIEPPMVISEASPEKIVEIALLLYKSGADIRRADSTGATPMWLACQNGPLSLCQFLYANGAAEDVRTPDRLGFTPMGRACSKGHLDIVQWLCTTSAKEDVYEWQNSGGATPFHVATRKGHRHVTSWLETMQPPAATSTPPRSSMPIPIPGAPRKVFS